MNYSKESLDRMQKIASLKKAWVICYANNYRWKQDIVEIRENFDNHEKVFDVRDSGSSPEWQGLLSSLGGKVGIRGLKNVDDLMNSWAVWDFKTAWRLMSSRWMWKLIFWKLMDNTWEIQICFAKDKVLFNMGRPTPLNPPLLRGEIDQVPPLVRGGETQVVSSLTIDSEEKTAFKIAEKYCQVGDYIGVIWDLFLTKHWELTIFVKEFQILSKAIRPLPEKFHGVTDIETIYRQRYLDLVMNDKSYKRFLLRSKFVKILRDFYHKNDFIEIETPVLWNAASGAAAKPFITHHNDFDEDFYLRIAPEIALKKATVWRFERVVEFARNFRNEWSDPSHMQEFSAIEHYAAWWNFEDNMKFTEDMFDYIFDNISELSREVQVKDKNWNSRLVNFTTPWQRINYIEWVKEACGIDVSEYKIWDEKKLVSDIKKAGVTFEWMDNMLVPTLIDYLYKKVLRPSIVWPAFVYNYPKTMQPLARQNDENPNIVEQFQLLVNGWEILKAYSELVDPEIQKANFLDQSKAIEKWDEEATASDDDFVFTMEYWMPPQSGWWMWIERIFTILTGQDNLRDWVLFPLMKSEKSWEKAE